MMKNWSLDKIYFTLVIILDLIILTDYYVSREIMISSKKDEIEVTSSNEVDDKVYRIKTRNSELLGKKHEVTGVEFIEKEVTDAHGKKLIGVFPVFDYVFEATIDSSMFKLDNSYQFKECNKQLRIAINSDVSLKKKFSKKQLEYIAKKKTPSGWTWHHYEELGKLRLVKTQIHSKTGHTGGRSIWCDEDYKIID